MVSPPRASGVAICTAGLSTPNELHMGKPTHDDEFDVFDVDEFMLDKEWVGQPRRFFRFARKLANAKRMVEECKAALDLIDAELQQKIRRRPKKYDCLKTTDKVVASCVLMQQEYKDAVSALITAKHRVDVLQAAVNALDHRKRALEGLVSLHGQSYFAVPKAPEHAREAVDSIEKKATRSGLKKRRKV